MTDTPPDIYGPAVHVYRRAEHCVSSPGGDGAVDLEDACAEYLSARGYVIVRRRDYDNLAAAIYDTPLGDDYLSNLDLAARRLVDVKNQLSGRA